MPTTLSIGSGVNEMPSVQNLDKMCVTKFLAKKKREIYQEFTYLSLKSVLNESICGKK